MAFAKGNKASKGRPIGAVNKVTALARDIIAEAGVRLGGVERLVSWAKEDPKNESAYWTSMFTKNVPHEISGGLEIKTPAIVELPAKKPRE